MSKNKLSIAIAAGFLTATATTGALAQTSSGNSSAAMGNEAVTAAPDNAGPTTTHKNHKHHHKHHLTRTSSTNPRTPSVETGNNAGAESGQSK